MKRIEAALLCEDVVDYQAEYRKWVDEYGPRLVEEVYRLVDIIHERELRITLMQQDNKRLREYAEVDSEMLQQYHDEASEQRYRADNLEAEVKRLRAQLKLHTDVGEAAERLVDETIAEAGE